MSTKIAVRCHSLMQKLIPKNTLQELVYAEDLDSFSNLLSETAYGAKVRKKSMITADSLYAIFWEKFMERCDLLQKDAGKGLKTFLQKYLMKFDVENLIKILRKKETKRSIEKRELFPFSFSKLPYTKLRQAESVEEVLTFLNTTPFNVGKKFIDLYHEYSSLLPIEGALWKRIYEQLLEAVGNLPDSRSGIKQLVKKEIDVRNCFTAVGPALYEESPKLAETFLIQPTFKVPLSTFQEMIHAEELRPYLNDFPYKKIMQLLLEREETKAEVETSRQVEKWLRTRKRGNLVSSLYVMMYMKLSEFEFRDLTKITYSLRYNIPSERMLNHMILISA